jgi:hypothetical protein
MADRFVSHSIRLDEMALLVILRGGSLQEGNVNISLLPGLDQRVKWILLVKQILEAVSGRKDEGRSNDGEGIESLL